MKDYEEFQELKNIISMEKFYIHGIYFSIQIQMANLQT